MTRRSYNNDRYTKDDAKANTTKKSASRAKPAREAAATIYEPSQKKTRKQLRDENYAKEEKRKNRNDSTKTKLADRNEVNLINPYKEQQRKWRKIWWVVLGCAVACVALSFFARSWGGYQFYTFLILSYVLVAAALVIEFGKIWRLRKKAEKAETEVRSKKQLKHAAEEMRAKQIEDAIKKENNVFNTLKRKVTREAPATDYPLDESGER